MKKLYLLTLIGVFGFALLGCRGGAPGGVSDEVYEIGSQGLDIVDQYLDNDLSRDLAIDELDNLLDELYDVINELVDEGNLKDDDEEVEWALIVVTDSVDDGHSYSDEEEMKTRRDALAELLDRD